MQSSLFELVQFNGEGIDFGVKLAKKFFILPSSFNFFYHTQPKTIFRSILLEPAEGRGEIFIGFTSNRTDPYEVGQYRLLHSEKEAIYLLTKLFINYGQFVASDQSTDKDRQVFWSMSQKLPELLKVNQMSSAKLSSYQSLKIRLVNSEEEVLATKSSAAGLKGALPINLLTKSQTSNSWASLQLKAKTSTDSQNFYFRLSAYLPIIISHLATSNLTSPSRPKKALALN